MVGQDLNHVLTPVSSPLITVCAGFLEATNKRNSVHPLQSQIRTWGQTNSPWTYWPGPSFNEEDFVKAILMEEQFLIAAIFQNLHF